MESRRIEMFNNALLSNMYLRAVYRLGRKLVCGVDESNYVIVLRKTARAFQERVEEVVDVLTLTLREDERIEYSHQTIGVAGKGYVIRYSIEGYKKQCDKKGYVENGVNRIEFIRRMGLPLLFRQRWMPARIKVESCMYDNDWRSRFLNPVDRYVAIARYLACAQVNSTT